MNVLIKRIIPEAIIPERHGACYDLAVPCDVTIADYEHKVVGLGFAVDFRCGSLVNFAKIFMRSSTFGKYGVILANCTGIIDDAYCGDGDEWKLSIYKPHVQGVPGSVIIPAGARIAQFALDYSLPVDFKDVSNLESANRGGFGSTGD